ncbi:MAG: TrkA C-terminal domain-containing protein [Gemmatimonadota bacterium]
MLGILSVLVILALSILITRVATVALTHTGLSRQSAAFQSRSAFTGVGFTTGEAESVVGHPVRRRIIAGLMLLGNVGIVTAISSLILGFVGAGDGGSGGRTRLLILMGGVAALIVFASSQWVDRWLSAAISRALDHWTRLEVRDYEELLHLSGDYRVRELRVDEEDWMAGCTLGELRLRSEGVNVLGLEKRDGDYVGVPRGETRLEPGDTALVYGRAGAIENLDERRRGAEGDREHREAVADQEAVKQRESAQQEERARDLDERGGKRGPPPFGRVKT